MLLGFKKPVCGYKGGEDDCEGHAKLRAATSVVYKQPSLPAVVLGLPLSLIGPLAP